MTDAEWNAIRPYLEHAGPGRPLRDPRGRLDLVFGMTVAGDNRAWRRGHDDLPVGGDPLRATPVKGDTLCRQFRRWTHAGLWRRLMFALVRTDCDPNLRPLAYWILRAARRAMRMMGQAAIQLARLLGQLTALPLPSWMLPDPILSESTDAMQAHLVETRGWQVDDGPIHRAFDHLRALALRRRPWSRRLAPP